MLAILADDLTGAADCGLQAVRHDLRTVVRLNAPGADADPADADTDVVAWDLDARAAPLKVARERTLAAVRSVEAGADLYLKIDSALRGHIGTAIDAALAASGAEVAIVAPAFPAVGRTTVGGTHRIASRTAPHLATVVDLLELLRRQSARPVELLDLDRLRRHGAGPTLDQLHGSPPTLLAVDAERKSDLVELVRGVRESGRRVVWVGSAGLAGALVHELTPPPPGEPPEPLEPAGPVLVVAGSVAPETLTQMDALLAAGGVCSVPLDAASLFESGDHGWDGAAAAAHLEAGRDVLLYVCASLDPRAEVAPPASAGPEIAAAVGEFVRSLFADVEPAGLVVTGGETARNLCEALGIEGISLTGEVETGVPIGRCLGRDLSIVTKAGSFGSPDALGNARDALRGRTPCRAR